ncbi:hypothetical protein ACWDSJ_17495 [Nocardia sp. NPDC003482]
MSGDEINIEPDRVGGSGTMIHTEAGTARTALDPLFDSAQPAADGNKGFATGAVLVKYAASLRGEIEDTITELETAGERIVSAAQTLHGMDVDNTTGFNRIATALNGLGKPPS